MNMVGHGEKNRSKQFLSLKKKLRKYSKLSQSPKSYAPKNKIKSTASKKKHSEHENVYKTTKMTNVN